MHQAQRPPRPDDDKLLATASKALGMDADDLKTALAGGRTLADVAKSKGVAKDDLVAAIAKDMQANAPEGAPAVDDAQATEMATNLVDGTRAPHGGHHGPPPGGPPPSDGTGTTRAQANLSDLASRLGLDPQALLAQLTSGTTLASSASRWSAGASVDGGLVVDAYA